VADDDTDKRMVAGLILVSRDWCWEQFLLLDHPLKQWAIDELAKWVTDGDHAPAAIKALKRLA